MKKKKNLTIQKLSTMSDYKFESNVFCINDPQLYMFELEYTHEEMHQLNAERVNLWTHPLAQS